VQATWGEIQPVIEGSLPPDTTIASAINNSTDPPTVLLGGAIRVQTNPPLTPQQKREAAQAISAGLSDVQGIPPGGVTPGTEVSSSQGIGSNLGATLNENRIQNSENAILLSPDQMPNSSEFAAPGVFSAAEIVKDVKNGVAYAYYLHDNGDGSMKAYLVTASVDDPQYEATMRRKIDSISGNVGFSSINKGTLQAVFSNEADLVRGLASALKRMANQLISTPAANIDDNIKSVVTATIERINTTAEYLLTTASAADAATNNLR
jgi:hypothetical protein